MHEDRATVSTADTQHNHQEVALENKTPGGPDYKAVRVHCHSVRKRLVDPDAVSIKAALDGVVEAGVIADDTTQFVKKISFSQEKGSDEKTIITIESAT